MWLRRLAKLGLVVVMGAYLTGCCWGPPRRWGHERYGEHEGHWDRGGTYGERH